MNVGEDLTQKEYFKACMAFVQLGTFVNTGVSCGKTSLYKRERETVSIPVLWEDRQHEKEVSPVPTKILSRAIHHVHNS